MKRSKVLKTVLASATIVLILLGRDVFAREPLTLKVWSLPDPKNTNIMNVAELALVDAFHKKHPGIVLRGFSGISIKGVASDSKALMAIAGGMSPDVLYVNFRQSETYISQGFLYPMDEFIARMPEDQQKGRVPEPVRPVAYRAGPDGQEHWWALPSMVAIRALMYRKDMFQEVGLNPNRPPKDWPEMEAYAERLTRPEKGTYGLSFTTGPYAAWDWMAFLWSAGGDAVAQDENGEWRAVFDSDEAVEAMLYYVHLSCRQWSDSSGKVRRGYTYSESDQSYKWRVGEIGMRWTSLDQGTIGGLSGVDPDIIGIAPVPFGPTGLRGSELNAKMMGIFSDIKPRDGYSVEEIRQAAFDYIWFWGSEEANRIRTKILVERGAGKFVNPLWLKKFGYEEYLELAPAGWLDVFEEAMKNGKPEPYGKNCQMVYTYMTYPMDECVKLERAGKLGKTDDERRKRIKEILVKAVARTNEEMIGVIAPDERRKRNNVALVVAVCMITVFLLVVRKVWLIFTPRDDISLARQHGGWQFSQYRWAYIIMLPAVASILLWKYYPMLSGTVIAFQDYRVVGESRFVGLKNLADVLWDPVWWKSLGKTLYYMALMLGLGFWTPIVLAILLAEVSRGKVLYRTLYYLPAVLTGAVVIYLWKLLFDPSDIGVLNMLLAKVGIEKLRWIKDEKLAMLCCVLPTVWAGMGPSCLIYLAALKSVPDDLYEAADIDGSGFFQKIWHITVPTIKGLIVIQFIGAFIVASQSAGFILVMTFGGPNEATKVAGLHIFEKAYLLLQFGSAITMAWLLGIVMLGFTTIQLKRLSRMEFTTAESRKTLS